jgi:GTPase
MVLVDSKVNPQATYTFTTEMWTFDGSTKSIKENSQPIVHIVHVRQAAKIIIEKPQELKIEDNPKSACVTSSDNDLASPHKIVKKEKRSNSIHEEVTITPNKKTVVTFQFLYNPEYITKDSYIIINESNLKAFGRIVEVKHDIDEKFGVHELVKAHKKKHIMKHLENASQEEKKNFEVEVDIP